MLFLRKWCASVVALLLTALVWAQSDLPPGRDLKALDGVEFVLNSLIGTPSWPLPICPAVRSFISFFEPLCNPLTSGPKSTSSWWTLATQPSSLWSIVML